MRLNDKLREQSELLPLSVFALSIQCVVASVIVLPPCVVTLTTDISVRQQTVLLFASYVAECLSPTLVFVLVKKRESHFLTTNV